MMQRKKVSSLTVLGSWLVLACLVDAPVGGKSVLPTQRPPAGPDSSSCRVIDWDGRSIGDQECEQLVRALAARREAILELRLICTLVTDASLKHLSRLDQLERLDLRGTQISDAGVGSFVVPKRLELLDLRATLVTAAGVRALRQRAPQIEVLWSPGRAQLQLLATQARR